MNVHELPEGEGAPDGVHAVVIERHGPEDFRVEAVLEMGPGPRGMLPRDEPFKSDKAALQAVLAWANGEGVDDLYVARRNA